jgi:hypothetical protein
LGHPFIAIAGRGDLECTHTQTPTHTYTYTYTDTKQQVISPFSCLEGAIDAKVVSIREAFGESIHTKRDTHTQTDTPLSSSSPHLSFHARVGPTHDQQLPFCWSVNDDEEGEDTNHIHTHPHCFMYEWDRLSPGALLAEALKVEEEEEKKRKGGGGAEEGQKRQFFLRRQNNNGNS